MHDRLFASSFNQKNGVIDSLARVSGLDMARFEKNRLSESVKKKVQADIETGIQLGVKK